MSSKDSSLTYDASIDYEIAERLHQRLIRDIDESVLRGLDGEQAREQVEQAACVLASEMFPQLVGDAKEETVARVADEVLGLGSIEPLLRDQAHVYHIIDRIVAAIGRHVDEASPMVDARLADGSRVNIIPPFVPKSPTITIRKFRGDRYTMTDLVQIGTLSEGIARFLEACVKAKLNIVVSGGTGTGKTTLLNAVSAFIPDRERIVTVEDPIELRLQQRHVIALEARPPSIEGKGEVTQRDLVRNALRMRPDRIIVGEVRGPEAFDMMQAMNTGHEGSLTTVHANSPRDALARIENMVLMAGFDLPVLVIRDQIASALHVLVHLSRLVDGTRKVTQFTEVAGMEGPVVTLQAIFIFKQTGVDPHGRVIGEMQATGIRPKFTDRLHAFGIDLTEDIFNVGRWG